MASRIDTLNDCLQVGREWIMMIMDLITVILISSMYRHTFSPRFSYIWSLICAQNTTFAVSFYPSAFVHLSQQCFAGTSAFSCPFWSTNLFHWNLFTDFEEISEFVLDGQWSLAQLHPCSVRVVFYWSAFADSGVAQSLHRCMHGVSQPDAWWRPMWMQLSREGFDEYMS